MPKNTKKSSGVKDLLAGGMAAVKQKKSNPNYTKARMKANTKTQMKSETSRSLGKQMKKVLKKGK